jgi:hypothetical protein
MSKVSITVKDAGLKALLKRVGKVPDLRVGVLGDDGSKTYPGEGPTVAQVAAWNELGAGVPRRSWLRDWVNGNIPLIGSTLQKSLRLYAAETTDRAIGVAGAKFVGEIQRRIAAGIEPPNAPATIARKGSSTPLIDQGQLRTSITWDTDKRG